MSFIATAIVGTVVGAGASYLTGREASRAAERGAERASEATVEATRMQVEELRRQFDYQAEVLYPRLEQQYAAAGAYGDLLGYGANNTAGSPNYNPRATGSVVTSGGRTTTQSPAGGMARPGGPGGMPRQGPYGFIGADDQRRMQDQGRADERAILERYRDAATSPAERQGYERQLQELEARPYVAPRLQAPPAPAPGSTNFMRNERGAFIDPNVDPLSLEANQRLEDQVRNTLLAGTEFEDDVYARQVAENQLREDYGQRTLFDADGTSRRMTFAEENQIFGPTFEESPGYNFMIEEMQREQDRRRSVGGQTLGARAQLELARRTQGMAAGEFYNWAAGRDRDLARMERAFDEDYQRELVDVGRMDEAARIDIGRSDVAMENYLGRRAGDVSRMDAAVGEADRLRAVDLQRRDQAYQNYLANVRAAAGFGDVAAQTVQASQASGGAVAGAYGTAGGRLANIESGLGATQADIYGTAGTNINNAITAGLENYALYRAMQ